MQLISGATSAVEPPSPGAFWRGLLSLAALLAAITAIKVVFDQEIGRAAPFLLYFGAVVVATWFAGWRLGMMAAVAATLLGHYLFVSGDAPAAGEANVSFAAALFLGEALAIVVLTSRLRTERLQAQARARQAQLSLTKVDSALSGVADGIAVQDQSGRILYANDSAARLLGYRSICELLAATPAQINARFDVFSADGTRLPLGALPGRQVLCGQTPEELLVRVRLRGNGEERWGYMRASGVTDAAGAVTHAVIAFHDVTEWRREREALRVSHEWFATTLRSIGDAVIATDSAGTVTFINPVAERLTGWTAAEAVGRPIREVLTIRHEIPLFCGKQRLPESEDLGLVGPNCTVMASRRGGELVIEDCIAPIRSAEGELVGTVVVFRDVSRQRAEERKRAFQARATEELASSLDYETTLKTVARLAVPVIADCSAVDIAEGDILRRLAIEHVDPSTMELLLEIERRFPSNPARPTALYQVFRSGKPVLRAHVGPEDLEKLAHDPEELRLVQQLGIRSYLGVPLVVRGKVLGVLTFAMITSGRHYTEDDLALATSLADRAALAILHARLYQEQVLATRRLEAARAEAEQASRAKDEFLAMLGHELRNPLAPILTALQLMKLRAPEALRRERAIVERQVRGLVTLVDDLLDVSRITRGKFQLVREPVDIGDTVTRALEMASPLVEERRHHVTVKVDPGLMVCGDASRLAQAVSNLVANAAKYTDVGGRIEVTAGRSGSQVELVVRDNGMGIDPELLPRIFDLFVQDQQSLDRAKGGLGLGLAIVRSIVELHGGEVTAHSEGPGRGSTFVITIPALEGGREVSDRPAPVDSPPRSRLLVVDDNPDALEAMAEGLRMLGHEVYTAPDGPSALEVAKTVRPSAALLDIGLPVMDGYELARQIRQLAGLDKIKLVALTGYGQSSDRERSRASGFDAHLVKPVSLEHVQKLLEELVVGPARS